MCQGGDVRFWPKAAVRRGDAAREGGALSPACRPPTKARRIRNTSGNTPESAKIARLHKARKCGPLFLQVFPDNTDDMRPSPKSTVSTEAGLVPASGIRPPLTCLVIVSYQAKPETDEPEHRPTHHPQQPEKPSGGHWCVLDGNAPKAGTGSVLQPPSNRWRLWNIGGSFRNGAT